METIDLKAFREVNNLTQTELGEYLGIQKAFISSIENGRNKLPKKKFTLLLQNPYGWDVSMLTQLTAEQTPNPMQNDALILELRAQIERLEVKIDNLNQELGEKNALLKMMRQGGEESARGAGISLSANAI
jgi:transcriptional regulator with XRE-family HTH domain